MLAFHELSRYRLLVLALGAALVGATAARATDADIPQTLPKAGHTSAQREIELAATYLMGRGVARDDKQAAYWYERAAEAGDPEAQKQIGRKLRLLYEQLEAEPIPDKFVDLLRALAEKESKPR